MTPPHDLINPVELAPAAGFSHAVVTHAGHTVWLAGQNGTDSQGRILAPGELAPQLDQALANLLTALAAAGGEPQDLVQLRIYVSDAAAYRAARPELGAIWRRHFGRYYPAITMLAVSGFYDPAAVVEVDGVAVVGIGYDNQGAP